MSVTATQRKTRRDYRMHGNSEFVRAYKQRGYSAIDGRTYAGREAKLWREAAIRLKGGASCPFHLKLEINSAHSTCGSCWSG